MATRSDSGRGHRAPREHVVRELRRVNRALLVLGECNQALVRAGEEEALLGDVCRILVDHGRYRMAWVGYAECDAGKSVRPVAKAGDDDGYLDGARIGWGDDERGHGPSGEAIRTGQAQVNRDFRSNPAMAPWRAEALRRGFESSVAIPLKGEDAPLGVLCVYAAEPDAFDGAELRLLEELAADLSFGIATLRSREAHRRADAMVSRLAYFDTLTGLPNRTQLLERFEGAMRAARESGGCLALLTVNVNRFDDIQIGLGLRRGRRGAAPARRRGSGRRWARANSSPASAATCSACSSRAATPTARARSAERLQAALAEPFRVAGILLDVQARIGAALFPEHGADGEALMLRSNIACREARRAEFGFAVYSGATDEESPRQARAASASCAGRSPTTSSCCTTSRRSRCGRAASSGSRPWCAGGTPSTACSRRASSSRRPSARASSSPSPRASSTAPCGRRASGPDRGLESRVAINISPSSLRDPEFPAPRGRRPSESGGRFPAGSSSSSRSRRWSRIRPASLEVLTRLRALGVSIFIDDFGTGYSSLSYIATLPIQGLKIDRSFVAGMLGNALVHSVVEATISLARALQIRVVAEGVETREQAEALARLGCDEIQGYHVGAPMAADEFERWAAQRAAREAGQPAGD